MFLGGVRPQFTAVVIVNNLIFADGKFSHRFVDEFSEGWIFIGSECHPCLRYEYVIFKAAR